MLSVISVFGHDNDYSFNTQSSPTPYNPTGIQGGVRLDIMSYGLYIYVDVYTHLGPDVYGLDGIMGRVAHIGGGGLTFIRGVIDGASGWSNSMSFISENGNNINIMANPVNFMTGAKAGRVARLTFRMTPTISWSGFTFQWQYTEPLSCMEWGDLNNYPGENLVSSITTNAIPFTPIRTLRVAQQVINPETPTTNVPVYVVTETFSGVSEIFMRFETPLPITDIIPAADFIVSDFWSDGDYTGVILSKVHISGMGTNFFPNNNTPIINLVMDTSLATATGGSAGDGVYPINVDFINHLGDEVFPKDDFFFGEDIILEVTNGAVVVVEPTPVNHAITFDLNGGTRTGGGELTQTITHGEDAILPTFTPPVGYELDSWDGSYTNITGDIIIKALWRAIPEPLTIIFNPANVSINDGNLSQVISVQGTAMGDITIDYAPTQLPNGVTVAYNATAATVTITGVRPTTNVPAVTGNFNVSVTREGITESFTVSVNLTTTWTPSHGGGNQGGNSQGGNSQGNNNQGNNNQDNQGENNQNQTVETSEIQNDSVPSEISVTISVGDETTVTVSLADFNIDEINPYRIIAIAEDGTIIVGTLDADGLFTFESQISGEFTIIYAENLIRLSMQVGSPVITDLAGNAPTQTMDVLPVIQDGRTLVPIRFIAEALGADVNWNGDTRKVTLTLNGVALSFAIGEAVHGMEIPAQIINNRTFVPLGFVSEYFKATVNWCDETRNIEIITL
jgi:hypothetical protein